MKGLDILEYTGEGYARVVRGARWTVAALNYAARFDERNIVDLERHNLTDETFVLLSGSATLIEGEDAERIQMEPLKIYNVRAGAWHNIFVSPDAHVLVVENADTSKDNTEYLDLKTRKVFRKHPSFEEVLPGTFLLKVPFGPVWTGIILVRGEKNFLVDSSHLEPERYLIPALGELGMKPSDIDWLLCTHVHGDHTGGHHSLHEKYGVKVATLASSADALRDPVEVAVRVRTRFPKNSPPPQSYLKGVEPDKLLAEGELLEGRLRAIAAPGHDDDCLVWIDDKTGTAFTGDSLQANGTVCQGIAFYRDLAAYRDTLAKMSKEKIENIVCGHDDDCLVWIDDMTGTAFTGDSLQANGTVCQGIAFYRDLAAYRDTLAKLSKEKIENIVCGHDYDGIGAVVRGREAVASAIRYSEDRVKLYGERIAAYLRDGVSVEKEPVSLARRLICEEGCGMPERLFLAMHTVSEHLKELGHDG